MAFPHLTHPPGPDHVAPASGPGVGGPVSVGLTSVSLGIGAGAASPFRVRRSRKRCGPITNGKSTPTMTKPRDSHCQFFVSF
jgi:hypothetical protein